MKRKLPSCVWIIYNGHNIEERKVLKKSNDLITLKILSTGQGTRLRRSKVYTNKGEAEKAISVGIR